MTDTATPDTAHSAAAPDSARERIGDAFYLTSPAHTTHPLPVRALSPDRIVADLVRARRYYASNQRRER